MLKYKLLIIVLVILAAGALLILYFGDKKEEAFFSVPQISIHFADDPSVDLSHIRIKAFYFVPQNLKDSINASWPDDLDKALLNVKQFYTFQLNQKTDIVYEIYPEPIVGLLSSKEYDGSDTSHGNPNALVAIQKELNARVFAPGGDLYQKLFSDLLPGEHSVISILYEGVGASAMMHKNAASELTADAVSVTDGTIPAFLVSKFFLTSKNYTDFGNSVFAHEFGHMLGLPDNYDPKTGNPIDEDIMGAGRFRPLGHVYLSIQAKKKLGLTY